MDLWPFRTFVWTASKWKSAAGGAFYPSSTPTTIPCLKNALRSSLDPSSASADLGSGVHVARFYLRPTFTIRHVSKNQPHLQSHSRLPFHK